MNCYVCHKAIDPQPVDPAHYDPKHLAVFVTVWHGQFVRRKDLPVYIGKDNKKGGELYRHDDCAPGSPKWLAAQKAKRAKARSELYSYFLLGSKGGEIKRGEGHE